MRIKVVPSDYELQTLSSIKNYIETEGSRFDNILDCIIQYCIEQNLEPSEVGEIITFDNEIPKLREDFCISSGTFRPLIQSSD